MSGGEWTASGAAPQPIAASSRASARSCRGLAKHPLLLSLILSLSHVEFRRLPVVHNSCSKQMQSTNVVDFRRHACMQVRYYLAYITGCLAVLLNTVSMCIDQCCIHRVPLVRSVAPNNSSFPMYSVHYYPRCSTAAGDPCLI